MGYWRQFEHFDPLTGTVPYWPFSQLNDIVWRARNLLRNRKSADITHIAHLTDEMVDDYFKQAKEDEISRLRAEQQWEYLESDDDGTIWDLKSGAESELDFPTADNTKDLDALAECIGLWSDVMGDGSPDPEEYEYYAAVALWKAADVIYRLNYSYDFKGKRDVPKDRKSWDAHDLIGAGEMLAGAMEAVCRAEQVRLDARAQKRFAEKLEAATKQTSEKVQKANDKKWQALQEAEAKQKSDHGKKMAQLSLKRRNESMAAVLAEWEKDPALKKLSNAKASVKLSAWLGKQDLEVFEPKTIAEWISAHKKKASG